MKGWGRLLTNHVSEGALRVLLLSLLFAGAALAAPAQPAIRMDILWPYYHPAVAQVPTRTPIEWANPTSLPHTVTHDGCTAGACAFDSGPVRPGDIFTLPGLPPGRYSYHCSLHPVMRGVLVVQDRRIRLSEQSDMNQRTFRREGL